MEFKGNQSQSNTNANASRPVQGGEQRFTPQMQWHHGGNKKKMLVAIVLIIALLAGSIIWWWKMAAYGDMAVKNDRYQALFLSNGQVYFGKLTNVNKNYVTLKDIYYLQVQQSVQPAQKDDKNQQQPQVSLAKLGSELHGPDDEMQVNRDQVLFWENLKDDSKVVKAIKENQK